ncbi:conserved hypothetical protein [Neospora caninum Liverpool]|uniref:Transmembrane protein n=1 Tax=Neospora caninum (strain Liverpool) TaxID=572307 RepID=F0VA22_NEOCL|nr:conserved hypothetical protein [Neospora caninum Liverpool]CBZ50511.1 conserved hypothetical protein [Neospora caninum Liverpool]CEL65121.1 TPA: hypothetical protein BN1204_009800 [Neospora caninum Liverpool]|eukprot:XP_003880544.1 conserved hypothetical protein [Neospora caninum Liverpool]
MGFFLPALFVGGLGMTQHLASRELDDLLRQAEQPLFGFWWGVGFGVIIGVWVGYNFSSFFFRLKHVSEALWDLLALGNAPETEETQTGEEEQPRDRIGRTPNPSGFPDCMQGVRRAESGAASWTRGSGR